MLHMHATLAAADGELVVGLDLRNDTGETVYVPVLPADAAFGTHPGSAYVHLTGDGLGVSLILGPSMLPPESVEVRMAAYHIPLLAGRQMTHTLRFPVPVREWCAYFLPAPEAAEIVPVYQVHMSVHAVRQSRTAFVEPVPQHDGYFQVGAKKVDLLRQTLTPDLPLPVAKHPDPEFPRL